MNTNSAQSLAKLRPAIILMFDEVAAASAVEAIAGNIGAVIANDLLPPLGQVRGVWGLPSIGN